MNIVDYIVKNWDTLPKSKFDDDRIVIFKEIENDDWGYGHHSYAVSYTHLTLPTILRV